MKRHSQRREHSTLRLVTPEEAAEQTSRALTLVRVGIVESVDHHTFPRQIICGACGPNEADYKPSRNPETGAYQCQWCNGYAQPLARKLENEFEDYLE